MPHAIKKLRNIPQTAQELRSIIKANLENAYNFKIDYEDIDGDKIAIMDDDDLQLAYEEA